MKNTLLSFCLLFSIGLQAQDVLTSADSLIELKQYSSAFKLLDDADPENKTPAIATKKTEIVLDYFATSINHRMFALKDLEPGEVLMELRGSNGTFEMYPFDPSEVLPKLITENPQDFTLHAALGKYYHELHTKYGSNGTATEAEIIDFMHDYCLEAANNGVKDAKVFYIIGYCQTLEENYAASIKWFENSLEIDPNFGTCNYNLAIAYFFEKENEKALPYILRSIELYDEVNLKSDALRVAALLYKNLEQHEKALSFFENANQVLPNNYYNLNQLLDQQLFLKKYDDAEKSTEEFYALDPSNPRICSDLVEIYGIHNELKMLESFFLGKTETTKDDEEQANLYFHLGQLCIRTEKEKEAKRHFKTARKYFEKVFEKDHYVFKIIDEALKK